MPPTRLLDQCKRTKIFINSKGYPRYCTTETDMAGNVTLKGGRSRRGKYRGPPGSKALKTALKGCDDPYFLDFMRQCLQWLPDERMTPREALRHDWLRRRLPKAPSATDCTSGSGANAVNAGQTRSGGMGDKRRSLAEG